MMLFDPLTFKPIEIREDIWDAEDEEIKNWLKEYLKLNNEIHGRLIEREIIMTKIIIKKQMTFSDFIEKLK